MSELRSGLRKVRDGLPEPSTSLDDVFDRARRHQRARRVGTAVFAFVLFAGAATGAWLAFRGAGSTQPAGPDGARFAVDLGAPIADAAVGPDGLWVVLDGGSDPEGEPDAVVLVNEASGEVIRRTPIAEAAAIAVGEDSVWVTDDRSLSVARLDPATANIVATFELPEPRDVIEAAPEVRNDIAVIGERVWVSTAQGGYGAIDIATNEYDEGSSYFGAFGRDEVRAISAEPDGDWFWMAVGSGDPYVIQVETGSGRGIGPSMVFTQHPARSLAATDRWVWLTAGYTSYPLGCDLVVDTGPGEEFSCGALLRLDPGAASPELEPVLATGREPSVVVADDAAAYLVDGQGRLVRVDAESLEATTIARVESTARVVALADGLVLTSDGSTLAAFEASPATATVEPEPTTTASPEPTGTGEPGAAGRVPEGACAFPAYRPGYLPAMGDVGVDGLPEPHRSRSYEGGGPQGLDPGYSLISWPADERGSGVHMWRATQSSGSLEADPDVPPLPDGSTGSIYAGEGGEDVAIIWTDSLPGTHPDECGETLLGVGVPGATPAELRRQIIRVAESLVPFDNEAGWPMSGTGGAFAVWPVDVPDEAAADQVGYVDPEILALTFGDQVIGWPGCLIVAERTVPALDGQAQVEHRLYEVARAAQGPTVEVEVAELLPGQWFVTAVYGTAVQATVTRTQGWTIEVAWDGPDAGGQPVEVRVGFGNGDREVVERATLDGGGVGSIRIDHLVDRFEMNVPGHVVILFFDGSGQPYVAQAFALPPGESVVTAP